MAFVALLFGTLDHACFTGVSVEVPLPKFETLPVVIATIVVLFLGAFIYSCLYSIVGCLLLLARTHFINELRRSNSGFSVG